MKQTNINGVWKRLCPQFVFDFKGFEVTLQKVTEGVIEMGKQLNLELKVDGVEELLSSYSEKLSNEDITQLETQKIAEEEAAEVLDEKPSTKRFTSKQMV